jgi:hypothetical protein
MSSLIRGLFIFTSLFLWSFYQIGFSQVSNETGRQLIVLEKEYNDLLQSALKLQVKADSLVRISNLKRSELTSVSDEAVKARLGNEVLALEKQSFEIQAETNRKYAAAREIEMRLLALKRSVPESTAASTQPSISIKTVEAKKDEINLLNFLFGKPEIEPYIGPSALARLKSIEGQAYQVNKVFNDVSEINQEIENLKILIDSNPRSRKNRNHRKEIEELQKKATLKNLEALAAIQEVNRVKLEILGDVVNAAKVSVTSRELIQKASVHEGSALENIREASDSRKVAIELKTEKFSHDYLLRAHQKELMAMDELYKAFDLFTGKSATTPKPSIERSATASVTSVPVEKRVEADSVTNIRTPAGKPEITLSENIVKEEKPESMIPLNISLPAGLAYRIQVGIYQNDVPLPDFKDLPNLSGETEEGNGTTRYFSGMYVRFGEAERALLDVRRLGFRDAFIVSYLDGRRIPVNRAVSMEREREERPAVVVTQVTVPETAEVVRETIKPAEQTGDQIVFKVQIGVFRNLITQENRDRFMKLAGNQKLDYTLNNNGLYVYTIGNFNTFEEAVLTRDKLVSGGINDAFVVVFKNGVKIPLSQVVK